MSLGECLSQRNVALDWLSQGWSKTAFSLEKEYTFWPSWDSCLSALWVRKEPDEAGGHIEKSGKHAF